MKINPRLGPFFSRPDIKALVRIQNSQRHNEAGYTYWLTTELIKQLAKKAATKENNHE